MPELPEVETIARDLRGRLPGCVIERVWLSGKPLRLARPVDRRRIERAALGARIDAVRRRGKYLILDLSSGHALLIHLGMSGRLALERSAAPRQPHTHCVLALAGGHDLRFVDPRRFGLLTAYPGAALASSPELRALGPDPLTSEFTPAVLLAALRDTRGADVKTFLVDQRRVAGVGNIYASEALFLARIHPRRPAHSVSAARATRLHAAVREVLESAVQNRGTTLRDYVGPYGWEGENQEKLRVYMREGEPCPRCRARVRRLTQQARSTFYCPRCQR